MTARWHAEFDPEAENAFSAMDWALSHDEVLLAARIAVGLSGIYRRLVGAAETRNRLQTLIERLDAAAHPALAARAWAALSRTTGGLRRVEAAQRAIELGERCDDSADATLSLSELAFGLMQAGRAQEAQAAIERAMRRLNESGLTRSAIHASVLNNAAMIANDGGRLAEARQLYGEALALSASLADREAATGIRLNLAELEFDMGNFDGALALARAIEAEPRVPHMKRFTFIALQNGAAYRLALGDIAGARAAAADALQLARGAATQHIMINIQHLATVAARTGQPHRAARLRGYVDAWYRSEGYERESTEQHVDGILTTALSAQLSESEIEALAAEGARLSEDQAVAEALAV